MTISKRLYINFGIILAGIVVLCLVNILAVEREHSARNSAAHAWELAQANENIRNQVMQNRQYLSNYLLSGDSREVTSMNDGIRKMQDLIRDTTAKADSDQQRSVLTKLADSEAQWENGFARPLLEKRKQVDSGNATVADLQIQYLQLDPASFTRNSAQLIDQAEALNTKALDDEAASDKFAGMITLVITILGTLAAIGLGGFVAVKTAKSITQPLEHLISVAREIGDSGDLEHQIDLQRQDEIGQLGRSFGKMVGYLREMASVSEAIARGDLTVQVHPRSGRDTLALAFMRMVEGLPRTGQQYPRQCLASFRRRQPGSSGFGRIGQAERAGFVVHRRSHQHHARDERQRAEHGEEHADAGFQRERNVIVDRRDGGLDSARRRHGQSSARHLSALA